MLRVTVVFIFLAAIVVRPPPIKAQQLLPGDEGGSKCGSCPCGNPCPSSSPPPPSYPSPPPPSPSPPPPTPVLPPPTPKSPPSSSNCPPPPTTSIPSGPIYPNPPPSSSYVYFTGPPGQLYPIDQSSATAIAVNIMGFALFGLIGNAVVLDLW